jgi:ABC-type bacteriocin/lantibiotic exporter with double-glycine peptidase domain
MAVTTQTGQPAPEGTVRPPRKYRRVKTPTVLQMEAVECGCAALAMVLAFYGRIVPLEELRVACGVSRDGSKASNMLAAARSYGLIAKGFRQEPEDLPQFTLPMIAFWQLNHFVVVEGFGKDKVYLNDPAEGHRTVSDEEFNKAFPGIILTFEPGPDFKKGGRKRSLLGALAARLSGSWGGLIYSVLVGLTLAVPGLLIPVFSKVFVDDLLVQGLSGWVGPLLIGLTLTAVLRAALSWLQQYYLLRLTTKLSVSMSGKFVWHVLRLPMDFYAQRYGGEIAWRVQLNDTVA